MSAEKLQPKITQRNRATQLLDAITGTNRAKSKILSIIDTSNALGSDTITDREILRQFHRLPGSLLISDIGISRALDSMEKDGELTRTFVDSIEAVENNTHFGHNYKRPLTPTPNS